MNGQVLKRGSSWAYRVDAPPSLAQRCTACRKRIWLDGSATRSVCATCGGNLANPTTERRQRYRGGFKTRKQCEAALRKAIGTVEQGGDPFPDKITTRDFFDRWFAHQESRVRRRTHAEYERLVQRHVLPVCGDIPLGALRPAHIVDLQARMLAAGSAPRTVRNLHGIVGNALGTAVKWGMIPTNPAKAVDPPRAERPELEVPTADQANTIMRAAVGTQWETPIMLAFATGARRSELLALEWSSVDLASATVRVSRTLQQLGTEVWFADVKTPSARREIALPGFAVARLRRQRLAQQERRLALGPGWQDNDLVCDRGDGAPLRPDALTRAFRRLAKQAGCPKARLHDARHAYATLQLSGGVHPATVSRALGHSSTAFTSDVYATVLPSHTEAAAAVIDAALGGDQ